ncbi:protein FAR1-RELATED SEQUENCE 5-like [Lotus japonicus]|uniref:protein FAR1-RELATED SEQUENCE 5-like n=1 Tax=Lotus japonicus TaxID=34305 RepID=UPI00258DC08B|nr:protein FAR1-RELATED SEQUENCE 5-like [Lotus japonicus]
MAAETEESRCISPNDATSGSQTLAFDEIPIGVEQMDENSDLSLTEQEVEQQEEVYREDEEEEEPSEDEHPVQEEEEPIEEQGNEEPIDEEEEEEEEPIEEQEEEDSPVETPHASNEVIEIAINGMEDMGMVNFHTLEAKDAINYNFPDRETAFLFYSWYGRLHEFACRKCRLVRNKAGEVVQQTFVCYREGKKKDSFGCEKKRKREPKNDTRCGCRAHFMVHIDWGNNRWYVKSILDAHNHVMVEDSLIGLVYTYRKMNEADIMHMNDLRKSGVSTSLAYGIFANQMGGYCNVDFNKHDMQNQIDKQRRAQVIDAKGVLAFFRGLKETNEDMYWKHTSGEDGRLDKLFWCDGCSQRNYLVFGDVLAFDATYKKNKYKRPLVVFSGVNHHNQTIVFAAALVSNEKVETYIWLLEQFLDVMKGKAPISVMTDGDLAMKNAIRKVFPRAHHRLCAWHLLRNATSNVSNPNFTSMLRTCMIGDLEIGDFEAKWAKMVEECGVEDNDWVRDLYEMRNMWATAHMRGEFFGGYRTTSRVEGLHAQIGKFIDVWNNLTDFMHNFFRFLSYQRFRELEADLASLHGDQVLLTQLRSLERSASNIYTKSMFKNFRRGLQRSLMLRVNVYKETSTCIIYFVSKYRWYGKKWHVSLWTSNMDLNCSCMRMESFGIPCDHILAVIVFLDMDEVPKYVVLERWTKIAKESLDGFKRGDGSPWDPMMDCRLAALRESCRRMCKVACVTPEFFTETHTLVISQAEKLEKAGKLNKDCPAENGGERYLRNPTLPAANENRARRSQGRGTPKRTTHCGICGGAGHNRKTCVVVTQGSQVVETLEESTEEVAAVTLGDEV